MQKSKTTGIIGVALTIILLVFLIFITNVDSDKFFTLENSISKILNPVQNALTYLKNKVEGNNDFFIQIEDLKKENEKLKSENQELQQNLKQLELVKSENITLKKYMNIAEQYNNYEIVPAYIINKDIRNYNSNIIINVGKKDGIEKNMPVICENGLVGHVVSCTDTTSKVQVIIDTASTVSGVIANNREAIICRGILEKQNSLKVTFIPTDAKMAIGDKIETSGLGGIYPKGIMIGEITEIIDTQNITDRYAIVKSDVNFAKLENVGVIKKQK